MARAKMGLNFDAVQQILEVTSVCQTDRPKPQVSVLRKQNLRPANPYTCSKEAELLAWND